MLGPLASETPYPMGKGDVGSEILDLVAGRPARRQNKDNRSRVSELFGSSDDESGSAGESLGVTVKSAKRDLPSSKKTLDNSDEFSDGYGPDLMRDIVDRQKLAAMTEVEREAILYERAQARLARRERRELEQKMKDLEQRQFRSTRPTAPSLDKKRKSLEALKARREKRHRKQEEDDSDYSEQANEDEDGQISDRYAASDSDLEQVSTEKVSSLKKSSFGSKKEDLIVSLIDLDLVNELLLARDFISKWVFHPSFDELAKGCLLRLSVGFKGNEQIYRPVEIKKIVKYHRTYKINEIHTNKAALLKYGRSEKTFRLDIVSNSPISHSEFERWMLTLREENQPIILKKTAEARIKAWRDLLARPVSDETVSAMVAAKRELGAAPRNLVAEKTMLSHLRDEASGSGNFEEVQRIDEELAQLGKDSSTTTRPKANIKMEALAELNRRNRRVNVATAREAERKTTKKPDADVSHDPFSRRKCAPSNFNSLVSEEPLVDSKAGPVVADQPLLEKRIIENEKKPLDLFTAHNLDIELDI